MLHEPSYGDFCVELEHEMDRMRERYSLGDAVKPDKVFAYLIADLFCGLSEDQNSFVYSDGPNDLGVDFWMDDSDNGFWVCQCKSCDYLGRFGEKPKSFDSKALQELRRGLDYLVNGGRDANEHVKRLRGFYQDNVRMQRDGEIILQAIIAVMGDLTKSAQDEAREIAREYEEKGISLVIVDWKRLYGQIHTVSGVVNTSKICVKLYVADKKKDILQQPNWFAAVVGLGGLIDAFQEYGNDLFDLNVRAQFRKKSRINQKIVKGLKTTKGRKRFTHLNNGILVVADSYKIKGANSEIILQGAQIVNGCQTVTSIVDAYRDVLEQADDADEIRSTQIMVKVLSRQAVADQEALNAIILSTNDQNPMTPRNLKANSEEQKSLRDSFRANYLQKMRYFYVRKDNELEAAISGARSTGFEKSAFEIEGTTARKQNKYRSVENKELAQVWLAWIGDAQDANQQSGDAMFKEDSKPLYNLVFRKRPGEEYWNAFSSADFVFQKESEMFESQSPHVFQYLFALAIFSYTKARLEEHKETKSGAIRRLIQADRVSSSASDAECVEELKKEREYYKNYWRRNMVLSYVELSSFVVANIFGSVNERAAAQICKFEDVRIWIEKGMMAKNMPEGFLSSSGFLFDLYEFVNYVVGFYLDTNYEVLLGETKVKAKLGKHSTLSDMKRILLQLNESLAGYPMPFKRSLQNECLTCFEWIKQEYIE